jgi:hypothetical protein
LVGNFCASVPSACDVRAEVRPQVRVGAAEVLSEQRRWTPLLSFAKGPRAGQCSFAVERMRRRKAEHAVDGEGVDCEVAGRQAPITERCP